MTTTHSDLEPNELVANLLRAASGRGLCVLDSCDDAHRGSQMLYAGVSPSEIYELTGFASESLHVLDEVLTGDKPAIFTLSYEFGRKLQGIGDASPTEEPDVFIAQFDSLIAYDYRTRKLTARSNEMALLAEVHGTQAVETASVGSVASDVRSNYTKKQYLAAIEEIRERIRCGDTYQTNLTQKITVDIPDERTPAEVFRDLRQKHPAPYSAYIERHGSTVVSASPESFFRLAGDQVVVSPIKGTRPRGKTAVEDAAFRNELLSSQKDRAENTMIVDLMRNDLGRVCKYGSVAVRELCALQELPTLFHLVSTVEGQLREDTKPSDILKALFPCGSITGAPKIRTMQIIHELEPNPRGLSMGAIGIYIPKGFGLPPILELSVAIRTMVIRERAASFNVGGGVVIDSDPQAEYEESLLKAKALLDALGLSVENLRQPDMAREQFETGAV